MADTSLQTLVGILITIPKYGQPAYCKIIISRILNCRYIYILFPEGVSHSATVADIVCSNVICQSLVGGLGVASFKVIRNE